MPSLNLSLPPTIFFFHRLQRHLPRIEKNVSNKTYLFFHGESESAIKNGGSRLRFKSCPPPHPQGSGGGVDFGIIRRPSSTGTTFILDIMS